MKDPTWFHLDATVEAITNKAILLKVDLDEIWIPFSQAGECLPQEGLGDISVSELKSGEHIEAIELSEWLGKKNSLERVDNE